MSRPLVWGILGNATIARKCVIPALAQSPTAVIRVLGSRDPRQAQAVCRRFGIQHLVEGYPAVLADPRVEAVYIPLPNHLHMPWTLKALSAGKHVLCEKPLACSAQEAQQMAAAAAGSGRLLMEAFMYRFHPRTVQVKQLIDEGRIGRPRVVRAAFCFPMDPQRLAQPDNPRLVPQQGGGALLDVGSYGVSTAHWMLGSEPLQVQATAIYHSSGADLLFAGTLLFAGEAMATVAAGFIGALEQTYCISGERGAIEMPHDAYIPGEKDTCLILRGVDQPTGRQVTVQGVDQYQLMIEHFADAAAGRCKPLVPIRESVANMRVLDALAQAARSGHSITLKNDDPTRANPYADTDAI